MKEESLTIRISKRRKLKLQQYAVQQDKTITALIEQWVDSLPSQKRHGHIRLKPVCRFHPLALIGGVLSF
jgi:hypothetical protein